MAKGKMGVMQTQFQKTPMMGAKAGGKSAGKSKDDGIDSAQKIWVGSLPEGITQEDIANAFGAVGTVLKASPMKNNTACVTYTTAAEAQSAIETFNGGDFNGSTLVVDVWTQKTPAKGGATGGFGAKGGFGALAAKGGFGGAAAKGKASFAPAFAPKGSFGGLKGGKAAAAAAPAWGKSGPAAFTSTKGAAKGGFTTKGGFNTKGAFGKAKGDGKGPNMRDYDNSQKVWVGSLPEGITEEDLKSAFGAAGTVKHAMVMKGNTGAIAFESAEEAQYAIETLNGGDLNGSILEVDVWVQKEKGEGKGKGKGKGKGFKGKV